MKTDPDSDNDTVGEKCSQKLQNLQYVVSGTLSLYCILTIDPRVLKHMKAYESFDDVRPTIRNKSSGLINT